MIGTFLFLVLFLAIARRLRGWQPAARTAFAAVLSIAGPVFVLSLLARLGIGATAVPVLCVFGALTGLTFVRSNGKSTQADDPAWLGAAAVALLVATLTALLGRPPTLDPLVDPWAHLAWSRNLPDAYRSYSIGFPAFDAIVGLGDRLVGAFRFAPMIVHFALAAQFLALGERFGKIWPGAAAAFAFLVVPVAFGKFEPPRPILLAAVFITASWWILYYPNPGRRWTMGTLAALACVLVITHASMPIGRRARLVLVVALAAVAGLVASPLPFELFFRPGPQSDIIDTSRAISIPGFPDLIRMWGLGLSASAAAAAVWTAFHFRYAMRELRGVLTGSIVWLGLCLAPLLLAGLHVQIPNTLAAYRYVLAAALPIAVGVTVIGARAVEGSGVSRMGVSVCAFFVAADVILRPVFSIIHGLIALGLIAAAALILRRPAKKALLSAAALCFLALAAGVRLVLWYPSPPPVTRWLAASGDPKTHIITNWPLTNELDALAPQPVIDGLAGADANLGFHRTPVVTTFHDRLYWCGDHYESSADTLRAILAEMDALPAYLVISDEFANAWRTYAEQRAARIGTGGASVELFFSAAPCTEDPSARLERIEQVIGGRAVVTREFDADGVSVYRIR
ncbi:MAG: hypothetical protein P8181_16105 [bacterium]